ncbi:hypothetical protein ABEF92_007848 [Exophiala dermatitidis]|uniref:Uncharacterized protein n=1 Tax=Exophiala dermatitidis (strain ATCC 34100 / CBS 525.76 / NIH/UT8656) TaxID=858893 RepID=H6BNH9_EXODN|nr:uncharacterized protein HMPREF1120_00570 [Exophiala dermatitidis NIH/UT8656]EHY52356.1 hypothetical protein HMPREF1120_00570 [Exophiala dermatitidis NIH/UT8656]
MDEDTVTILNNQNSPKHAWTPEDRRTLSLLTKLYNVSKADMRLIFNQMFRRRLQHEGFSEGVSLTTIRSQVAHLKRIGMGEYQAIQSMSLEDTYESFPIERGQIEAAAESLGISLLLLQVKDDNTRSNGFYNYDNREARTRSMTARSWIDYTDATVTEPDSSYIDSDSSGSWHTQSEEEEDAYH